MWQPEKYKTWPRDANQIHIGCSEEKLKDKENLSVNLMWKGFAVPGFPSTSMV